MATVALKKVSNFQAEPELQRQLQTFERHVEEATKAADEAKADVYDVPRGQSGTVNARMGQFVRLDTTSACTVHLPKPAPSDAGKTLVLRSTTGSAAINIVPRSANINGSTSSSASGSGLTRRVICDGTDYWTW